MYVVKIVRKNQEEPVDEKECKVEEVEVDEEQPDLDKEYDPEVSQLFSIPVYEISACNLTFFKCVYFNVLSENFK